jgi:hypothetical protein
VGRSEPVAERAGRNGRQARHPSSPFQNTSYVLPQSSAFAALSARPLLLAPHSTAGRAAIFVKKEHPLGQWDYESTKDWCMVQFPSFGLQSTGLELWSVYNPPDDKTRVLQVLLQ